VLKKGLKDRQAKRWQRKQIKKLYKGLEPKASRKAQIISRIRKLYRWLKQTEEPAPEPQQPRNRAERRALVRSLGHEFRRVRLNTHMRRPIGLPEGKYCREPKCKRHHRSD